MKCSECGTILGAGLLKCTNCGVPVNATLRYREVDEPVTALPATPEAVVDLTELDVVDLRELVSQLNDDGARDKARDRDRVAVAANTPAIRQAWEIQSRNSALLWPQKPSGPRPTTDDITPRH